MRYTITDTITVSTYETKQPLSSEPTERFSYIIQYLDDANQPRETEQASGFISDEDALRDAQRWLDDLDMTPEAKTVREPKIMTPYHQHFCKQACGLHRCVNPKCEKTDEIVPKRVAEIICPTCGEQTGTKDYFKAQRMKRAEYVPLEIAQVVAA
jgi:hypothetical protein